ncbi:YdcF family protein [Tessaracoccus sp. OH4464_COT-324]|uniref:YdcF family protein n=1 Tax=Tessaracoccus sp. OH4464_COT-324 TaxID=2491059 RepID=UPI00131A2E8F|nr:YdcF family protein [Tessaracoccus sp. OH4464_COT-324]
MWVIFLLCLVPFAIWFRVEPRSVWPGFLFTFALLALLAQVLAWLNQVPEIPYAGPVLAFGNIALLALLLFSPVILGVFLCVNFCTMLRKEGLTRATMIIGFLGALILGYLICLAVFGIYGSPISVALFLVSPIFVALGFGFFCFLCYSLFYNWYFARFGGQVGAVVVLGAGLRDGLTVSPLLARRVDRGLRLARSGWDDNRDVLLVLSGGQGPDERIPEAKAMSDYALEQGAKSDLVVLEDRSTTTRENLEFSAELLRKYGVTGPVAVATSDYHAFRGATMMRRAGISGYAVGCRTARYYWPAAMVREFLALIRDHKVFSACMLALAALPLILGALGWVIG